MKNSNDTAIEALTNDTDTDTDCVNHENHQRKRIRRLPTYLKDYHCDYTKHWCGLVEHKRITTSDKITNINKQYKPKTFKEAATNPLWQEAMNKELDALEANKTWDIAPLPKEKKVIGCKWIFKVKQKADGYH